MQNNFNLHTYIWYNLWVYPQSHDPTRENRKNCDPTRGSIRPVDNSDKSSYGFTGGSLSDRASVTWFRPVTHRDLKVPDPTDDFPALHSS